MERRDNGTDAGSSSSNDAQQTILGVVALVVSVVALIGTTLQVAQQYYASAAGYAECGESVMGQWHTTKRRKFRPYELRFEVQFETPVIFVCSANNKKGPVKDAPLSFINGSTQSLTSTRTLLPDADREQRDQLVSRAKQVHTADNERATWVMMLSELQSMEKDSQKWQQDQYGASPPPTSSTTISQLQFEDHTLAVALQPKKRSWDTMPSNVKKPYATTAMCHLLELAAMLGLHWKEFNRSTDRYRAEGNGYILTGSKVDDLGLMFTFQIYGAGKFQEKRIIPADGVKELCCGFISTIFREDSDKRRLELTEELPQDLTSLQVGSANDLAEAMVLIGCNTNTANYFRSDKTRHGHLFPVAFELVGMLSKCLHLPNSSFRMLPNPTPYHWDKKFFSLRKLLQEYKKKIDDAHDDDSNWNVLSTPQVRDLTRLADEVEGKLKLKHEVPDFDLPLLNALHTAILQCDDFLKPEPKRDLVKMVLREHFQEILRMVNDDRADTSTTAVGAGQAPATGGSPTTPTDSSPSRAAAGTPRAGSTRRNYRFDDLNSASPEEKQQRFMEIYFGVILPRVRDKAVEALIRRKKTRYAPSHHGRDPSVGSANSAASRPAPDVRPGLHESQSQASGDLLQPPLHIHIDGSHAYEMKNFESSGTRGGEGPMPAKEPDRVVLHEQANDIWCTLVFRMLCWLLLHDFNKKDVQISKSELLGSRLPVYIA